MRPGGVSRRRRPTHKQISYSFLTIAAPKQQCDTEGPVTLMPIIEPRDVPLGGHRAINVRRTLPHINRTSIGPWIFIDHYGPTITPMNVPSHPHVNLSTVSWLFDGEIKHDDSNGAHAYVYPGEVNLMTAAHGICHTEVSTADSLHGVQLWMWNPAQERKFEHYIPPGIIYGPATIRVFLGYLARVSASPVSAPQSAVGAEVVVQPGRQVILDLETDLEYGVLADTECAVNEELLQPGELWYHEKGLRTVVIKAGEKEARVLLLGGKPMEHEIIMYWNFVGTTQEEVAQAVSDWNDDSTRAQRYGVVHGYQGGLPRIPAPPIPNVRLRGRSNATASTHAAPTVSGDVAESNTD